MANIHLLPQELWADVQGYEGLYQISTIGNYRSMPKKYCGIFKPMRELKKCLMKNGYYTVTLSKAGEGCRAIPIHKLMAITFLPNPNGYDQVNHKNGIKTDNRIENLEWCSRSQNMIHAFSNGLIKRTRKKRVV